MAKEYIELEAAIMAIEKPKVTPGGVIFDALKKACQEEVRNLPAADVVEVVRCRDCKHSVMYKFTYNYERVLVCNAPGVTIRAVKPMHFCADGKHKDGGQHE